MITKDRTEASGRTSREEATLLAKEIVDLALRQGADQAEVVITGERYLSLASRRRHRENVEQAHVQGMGLKVFRDRKKAYVTCSDVSLESGRDLASRAMDFVTQTSRDPSNVLSPRAVGSHELRVVDPRIEQVSIDEKFALLEVLEDAAYDTSPLISNTESAGYWDAHSWKVHVNSQGLESFEERTQCGISLAVLACRDDERQVAGEYQSLRTFEDLDPGSVGREAAERAVQKLGARPVPSCKAPVVLDNRVGLRFLGYLVSVLDGERVAHGESFLAQNLGEVIAPAHVTVLDESNRENGFGNLLIDGEGVPAYNKKLLAAGHLATFLHNSYSAAKLDAESTGNVMRGSYESEGSIGACNLSLVPGPLSRDEILRTVPRGMLVTGLMGFGLNAVTGDYSIGASGLWIENGRTTYPVERVTLAANMRDMLAGIEEIGSDLRFWGSSGSPTFKIRQMTLSGT